MRKTLYVGLSAFILIILLLPYLLSVPPLKQVLIAKLESTTNANITIDTLRLNWLGPQTIKGIHLSNAQVNGQIDLVVLKTPFWKIASQPYSLQVTNGNFQVLEGGSPTGSIEQIQATVDGSLVQASGITTANGRQGSFSVQGTAVSADQFDLSFSSDQVPTPPIDTLLGFHGDLIGILGSSFSLNGSANNLANRGSVRINLDAVNARGSAQASFTPTYVTLDAPFAAIARLPPSILKKIAKQGLILKDPVALNISNDSFFLPRPFSLAKLRIGSGTLNLGRIAVPKPASFNSFSAFIKAPQLANPNQLDIWLTPADFAINEGLLQLARVDALIAQSIHLCGWGKINAINEHLNMILGVPSDTLAQTMLMSNAASDFVLQVPVTGTLKNPKFDTSSAAVQIAGSIATDQVQKVGGNFGAFGSLVGKTVSQAAQPEPTPPQRYRLPWLNNN